MLRKCCENGVEKSSRRGKNGVKTVMKWGKNGSGSNFFSLIMREMKKK
jgi:hypothetical protein